MNNEINSLSHQFMDEASRVYFSRIGFAFAEADRKELYNCNYFQPLLFHGTDQRVMSMDKNERLKLSQCLIDLRDFLVKFYLKQGYERDYRDINKLIADIGDKEKGNELYEYFGKANGGYQGNASYKYGNLYLTNIFSRALGYANKAFIFGEIGYIDYVLLEGIKKIGYVLNNVPKEMQLGIDYIQNAKNEKPDPVVYMYSFIQRKELFMENGSPCFDFIGNTFFDSVMGSFCVKTDYCATNGNRVLIYKNGQFVNYDL